jgi:phosphotransferase system enzyme I (PtsI)
MKNRKLQGISICEGLVLAPIKKISHEKPQISDNPCLDVKQELARFNKALEFSKIQIQSMIKEKQSLLGTNELQIFEAHLMFLEDPEYLSQITDKITNNSFDSTKAVYESSNEFSLMLSSLDDPYLSARSQDIQDIGQRLIKNLNSDQSLNGSENSPLSGILILKEIYPSFVAELNPLEIQGVITEQGGATSHAAILLKNLEIPALFGIPNLLSLVQDNEPLLMDARNGFIVLNPDTSDRSWFQDQWSEYQKEKVLLNSLKLKPATTKDGHRIHLNSNIGSLTDLEAVEKFNSDGIGLFRTEFLFLDRTIAPTEDEQYQTYSKILQSMKEKKTIIRTLDIGGDKEIPYLKLPKEENPFLGLRGLRLCLVHQDLFRTQIRALLRASTHGSLSVMYPMVSQLTEWEQAQTIVREETLNLEKKGLTVHPSPGTLGEG